MYMENKSVVYMFREIKKYLPLYFLILFFSINICCAQDISKRYVSKVVGNDNVFFVKPHEIPSKKDNNVKNPLIADFSIASQSDSVAFLFTVYTKEPIILKQIQILCYDRVSYSSELEKLFVVTEKKLYKGRYRCYISKQNLENLYSIDNPYVINLNKGLKFGFKPSKWQTEKNVITKIINLSEINNTK